MDELLPVEPVRPPSPARRRIFVVVSLVVVAAFVVVAGLEGSGFIIRSAPAVEATATPPTLARLAYVGLDGTLNTMDAGRASVMHFLSGGAAFQFPAWSPDGTRIAAISTDTSGTHLDVFTPPMDGRGSDAPAGPTTVYQSAVSPVFYAYWAPDSRAIAFLTTEPGGIALRRGLADATAPATIVRTGAPMYWQWVDASRLLVHSGGNAADAFAGEVGLDGTPATSGAIDSGSFRAPALSRDGKYVAFSTAGNGTSALVVESRDGSSRHDVPIFSATAFEFDPAGDALAFTASAEVGGSVDVPVGPLRVLDPATGAVRTLLDGSVVTFFWAPDGRTIAAISVPEPGNIKVASTGAAAVTLARAGPRTTEVAAGVTLRLTFVDAASGAVRSARVTRLSDLFINQVLPYFDQYALSHRFWSRDSRSLVLPIDDDQSVSRITTFFADGSDPVELVGGQFATWSP